MQYIFMSPTYFNILNNLINGAAQQEFPIQNISFLVCINHCKNINKKLSINDYFIGLDVEPAFKIAE